MKKATLLLLTAALVSCAGKPPLRKDVAEFIAQFSLETAMEQYKIGGYESTKIKTEDGVTTKEIETLEYTYTDLEHPTYRQEATIYKDDVVYSSQIVEFVQNEDGDFLSKNGELTPSSVKECHDLITKFFYKTVDIDGQYHTQGFYYGDYLKEVAAGLQKFVTIDQENQLYIMYYSVTERKTDILQNYIVNKWGMLQENHVKMINEEKSLQQDIYVHN